MYSKEIKEKALNLLSQGETAKRVQEILSEENEVTVSIPTIYSWKKKNKDVSRKEQEEGDSSNKSNIHKRDIQGKVTFNSSKPVYKDKNIEMLINVIAKIKSLINLTAYADALSLCEKYTTEYYGSKYPRQVSFIENQKLQALVGLKFEEKALELEEELEKKYPWNKPFFRMQKVKALANINDLNAVKKLSKKYEEEYPQFAPRFVSLRLKAYLKNEKYSEALSEIDESMEKYGIISLGSLKISILIGVEHYDEAIKISRIYEDKFNSLRQYKGAAISASQRVTALRQSKKYEEAEKEARTAIKKYPSSKNFFESQIISILVESKGMEEATKAIEIFKKQSPQFSLIYDSQLIESLISENQYLDVIEKTRELEERYGRVKGILFANQRIKALIGLGEFDEAETEAMESERRYPEKGDNFASQRLKILIEKSELEKAKALARELIVKYPNSKAIWLRSIKQINGIISLGKSKNSNEVVATQAQAVNEGIPTQAQAVSEEVQSALSGKDSNSEPQVGKDTDTPQLAEKPKVSLQKILEMREEEFETYVKTLPNRETLFAVVARSKKQNQAQLAIGYIDMYLKKAENADETLAKQLKTMAKAKTPIFDETKWDALAKRFNLDFNCGAKTLLSQMIELAKQINNYPFDLQIDKETLLAIQQLTKLNLSPDYPDEGQRIETER